MEKTEYQAELLCNRITKRKKILQKWARKNDIGCYRLYDKDIPEIPLCIDVYTLLPKNITNIDDAKIFLEKEKVREIENDPLVFKEKLERTYIELFLYERPYKKDTSEEEKWLLTMKNSISKILEINESHIITKNRLHQKGGGQYALKQNANHSIQGITYERKSFFYVQLTDYIDTGLFLDQRVLRNIVKTQSKDKTVLNLFSYTSSFSVYAAIGGAKTVESVDLSNTYLLWSRKNFILNGFLDEKRYITTKSDVFAFLDKALLSTPPARYDIIILDPPTFSNSKSTKSDLDINRDYALLINKCLNLLTVNGVLYFSTNSKRLCYKSEKIIKTTLNGKSVIQEEITEHTQDQDFARRKTHRTWKYSIFLPI